jgi:hypothetical protein
MKLEMCPLPRVHSAGFARLPTEQRVEPIVPPIVPRARLDFDGIGTSRVV